MSKEDLNESESNSFNSFVNNHQSQTSPSWSELKLQNSYEYKDKNGDSYIKEVWKDNRNSNSFSVKKFKNSKEGKTYFEGIMWYISYG